MNQQENENNKMCTGACKIVMKPVIPLILLHSRDRLYFCSKFCLVSCFSFFSRFSSVFQLWGEKEEEIKEVLVFKSQLHVVTYFDLLVCHLSVNQSN